MSSHNDDAHRPARQRANTSSFTFPVWRRGRPEPTTPAPPPNPPTFSPSLQWEELIKALSPPAVPSLTYARQLAAFLGTHGAHTSPPRLSALHPVLAALCSPDSPPPLQTVGYEILAVFLEVNQTTISTADRLSCLSLFVDAPWSRELWESRSKALEALVQDHQTIGMESQILRMLKTWIVRAFDGLVTRPEGAPDDRLERQRSVESLTALLIDLVRRPELVSRLTDYDTTGVLELWATLVDQALAVPSDYAREPSGSPIIEPQSTKTMTPPKLPLSHRRHHSSTSRPKLSLLKHPADIIVEAYLTYLSERIRALAHSHLQTIVPLLFRALAFYYSPLPRVSLQGSLTHQQPLEKRISDMLQELVGGPYASSCRLLMRQHFFPSSDVDLHTSMQTSTGALRTLRVSVRSVLESRLARIYIGQAASTDYSPAGVPSHLMVERGLMERAWAKDETAAWDLTRFANVLARAARMWISQTQEAFPMEVAARKEDVLLEIAAIVKDVIQAMEEQGDDIDDEEVEAVGRITRELVVYVRSYKSIHQDFVPISISRPDGSTPFLVAVATILAQDLKTSPLFPVLPSIILSIGDKIPDSDLANLLTIMADRQCFSPTSLSWLDNWSSVLSMSLLFSRTRARTRRNAMCHLQSVWEFVKDIPAYRKPLANLVFSVWKQHFEDRLEDINALVAWNLLADEAVFRLVEKHSDDGSTGACEAVDGFCDEILAFLATMAQDQHADYDDDAASVMTTESAVPSPPIASPPVNAIASSPILSRMTTTDLPTPREGSTSFMTLISNFTTGMPRSQSKSRRPTNDMPTPVEVSSPTLPPAEPRGPTTPRAVGAVIALVSVFSQLVFTPLVHSSCTLWHAKRVFARLVALTTDAGHVRARLCALQFLMRLRVDRDHRLYFASEEYDKDGHIASLAALIGRAELGTGAGTVEDMLKDDELRRARARVPVERDGRRASRGRGGQPRMDPSRSRSRVPSQVVHAKPKPPEPLWVLPEMLSLSVAATDVASEGMMSFDPTNPGHSDSILQSALYLTKLIEIIETEKEWEILSYVLCHLPTQLSNKHLFCGPKSRKAVGVLLETLCNGITNESLTRQIERWPAGIISRDAQGLAFHTLTVLISYQRCFENPKPLHHLIEVFLLGLSGQPSTQKCCLHALSLSAFELQSSMTKYLSRIMEKLSQIISNPAIAVHIIDFLAIVGSQPSLYVNFTEGDYKMVFAVALKYLEHHNRKDATPSISWALSQHVRIMSYYIMYEWFLAVDMPDRQRHVSYIVRQLLLANGGRGEVDPPTEVAFDWLARYTYASADPRPAKSTLGEIVMEPSLQPKGAESAVSEKTWILGNSVVTIRALARRGWIEVLSRRPSGLTKFLVRSENVPMVPLGDVDPDLVSVAGMLMMDREHDGEPVTGEDVTEEVNGIGMPTLDDVKDALSKSAQDSRNSERPDPITGYVWSLSAPSQRRKEVVIDPSYFALQLSTYPDRRTLDRGRLVTDKSKLAAFLRTFDRMPVIDTHKVGVMYVAPGQEHEDEILRNTHGSPAYTRFLEGLGRLIYLRGQMDVYDGGLDPDIDGEYAYAWWDDIGQILFHTATLMPTGRDPQCMNKKAHIGNDYIRIVWNDSGKPYKFDTLKTQFQFVNIVIEPHSRGAIAAFSDSVHEHEYFKVTLQRAPGMVEFTPIGDFKLISATNLPKLVRQIALLSDWFVAVWQSTGMDTRQDEVITNWRSRFDAIQRFRAQISTAEGPPIDAVDDLTAQQRLRDFTTAY